MAHDGRRMVDPALNKGVGAELAMELEVLAAAVRIEKAAWGRLHRKNNASNFAAHLKARSELVKASGYVAKLWANTPVRP